MGDGDDVRKTPGNNVRLLGRVWAVPMLLIVFAVFSVIRNAGNHAWTDTLGPPAGLILLSLIVGGLIGLSARRRSISATTRALREPSPDAVIAVLRRPLNATMPVPGSTSLVPFITSSCATFYACYGQYGRARDELDTQRWEGREDLYQAARLNASALIHYLSGEDMATGLNEARRAKELGRVPGFTPGARRAHESAEMCIDIGRVLCEGAAVELCDSIAGRARAHARAHIGGRLIAFWGAAVAMEMAGRQRDAEPFFAELRALAPHCGPLHRTPTARIAPVIAQGESRSRDDHALGACALHPNTHASVHCVRCGNYACAACARPISERASICGACYERSLSLRNEYAQAETRVRAAGVVAQSLAVLIFAFQALVLFVQKAEFAQASASLTFYFAVCVLAWFAGHAVRGLGSGTRWKVRFLASVMTVSLIGSLYGLYLLWATFSERGRVVTSPEYTQVLESTPEPTLKLRREVVLQLGLLGFSFFVVVFILSMILVPGRM
jgi:uncharacterized protein YggT (Ycf19 family)